MRNVAIFRGSVGPLERRSVWCGRPHRGHCNAISGRVGEPLIRKAHILWFLSKRNKNFIIYTNTSRIFFPSGTNDSGFKQIILNLSNNLWNTEHHLFTFNNFCSWGISRKVDCFREKKNVFFYKEKYTFYLHRITFCES